MASPLVARRRVSSGDDTEPLSINSECTIKATIEIFQRYPGGKRDQFCVTQRYLDSFK